MKVLLLSMLLLLLLCSTTVLSLECNVCADEDDNMCTTVATCAPEEVYCREINDDGKLMRTCEEFCDETEENTSCCQTECTS